MTDSTNVRREEPDGQPSSLKKAVLWTITLGLMLVLFEVRASTVLLYRYRFSRTGLSSEVSPLSIVNLTYKAAKRAFPTEEFHRFRKQTTSDPFLSPDPKLGYIALPNVYAHTYGLRHSAQSDWRSLKIKVTMNEDGSRWTGADHGAKQSLLIFGDSFPSG